MSFDLAIVAESLPRLLEGLTLTLALIAMSLAGGALLAGPAAWLLMRPSPWLRGPARVYVWAFRGTPALVQLFVIYYGLAQFEWLRATAAWGVLREPFWCCVLAFSLNSGAYTAEILRGAIAGVPAEQAEAARALGLSPARIFRLVLWPQALRLALPPYGNEVVGMIKTSALASTVTLAEVTGVAETIAAETFAPYEVFLSAAIIYLALSSAAERAIAAIECRRAWPC
ncbi:ABC transporter permease [Rubrimonas cliftonensis]|uniref:Amino acid ABC transporter membrane protein 2, PAAT family n=1 Tax=Rubrimonas cliftonensis TaxID=89524 RepID=A0A1H4GHF6_9RHOB|nr:ABC transporter permease subunit [Rubrimonas cliftonensis]SEB08132.1 amino acid ABC transporter membrane protein 2, PAAT family [Rubrimonas cliftonensis]